MILFEDTQIIRYTYKDYMLRSFRYKFTSANHAEKAYP